MSKLAILFPGQGSQSLGMLADIASQYPSVKETFQQASDVLAYDMWQLTQEGPAEKLNMTTHTQAAILTASIAIWRILQTKPDFKPDFLAGHSLGEYSALVAAQVIEFTDAVKLVASRGQFMQEAVASGNGAMAAIVGLNVEQVTQLCKAYAEQEVLTPVNLNAPEQIVIAGHKAAVERACAAAKSQGAKMAVLLPVSVPAHCELMKPAAEKLARVLETMTFHTPKIPVINNVDVLMLSDPAAIKDALLRQLYSPVRWVETIELLAKQGVRLAIECGPGRVLSGLVKRIEPTMICKTTNDLKSLQELDLRN